MNYHKITTNDIANGPGVRTTLWVSGCRCACPGCHNPQTWDFQSGRLFDAEAKKCLFEACAPDYIAGLTLSGGNPLEPENVWSLIPLVQEFKQLYPNKTIWIYCGDVLTTKDICGPAFGESERTKFAPMLFRYCDVVIDGPFIQAEKDITLPYCGSRNQRIIDVQKTRELWEIVDF